MVFVEGDSDFKTLRRFARVLGFEALSTGNHLTAFESGGFSSWESIKSFAWGVKRTIDANIQIFAIYDRDYFCDEQISEIQVELRKDLAGAHFLARKEMENYLLNVDVLQRAMEKQLDQKNKRQGTTSTPSQSIEQYLEAITESIRIDAQSQYVAKKLGFHRRFGKDDSTLSKQVIQEFEDRWRNIRMRMWIVPGKAVLRALREAVQNELGINLTDIQIIDEHRVNEIPSDLIALVSELDDFRKR